MYFKDENSEVELNDWIVVKRNNKLTRARENDVQFQDSTKEQADFWKPKIGDWCWFWDIPGETPALGQYTGYNTFMGDEVYPKDETKTSYQFCEPFVGELPTNLKK